MRTLTLCLTAVLCLQGCASKAPDTGSQVAGGRPWITGAADQLQAGTTTIAQARAMLGEPFYRSGLADGSTVLLWYSVAGSGVGDNNAAAISVLFGPDGVMRQTSGAHGFAVVPPPMPAMAPSATAAMPQPMSAPAPMPPAPPPPPAEPPHLGYGVMGGGI